MVKSILITQLLLAALVVTQIPNLISFIGLWAAMSRRSQHRVPVIAGLTPLVTTESAELICGPALRKIQCGCASKDLINLLVARRRRRVLLKSVTTLKIRKDFWQVKCQSRRTQASVGGTDANAGRLSFPSEHGP